MKKIIYLTDNSGIEKGTEKTLPNDLADALILEGIVKEVAIEKGTEPKKGK